MLLRSFQEPCVVDPAKLLQFIHRLRYYIQLFQDLVKRLLASVGSFRCRCRALFFVSVFGLVAILRCYNDGVELGFTLRSTIPKSLNSIGLESVDLLQLDVDELFDEGTLILFSPFVVSLGAVCRASLGALVPQERFELRVIDVLVLPWGVCGPFEALLEVHAGTSWCSRASQLTEQQRHGDTDHEPSFEGVSEVAELENTLEIFWPMNEEVAEHVQSTVT